MMGISLKTISVLLGTVLISTLGFAAQGAKSSKRQKMTEAQYTKIVGERTTASGYVPPVNVSLEETQKLIENSEKRRAPAQSGVITDNDMSKQLKDIRTQFLALKEKDSDKMDELLAKLDADYETLPTDAKFFAAQIIPARVLRGMVYRMREVFETRSRAVHSAILTMAKNTTTNFRIYLPADHMKAVQEYFMSPYYDQGEVVSSFNSEADIQSWLCGELIDAIIKAEGRIAALNLVQPIVWDQRFTFGPDSFKDGLNRYRYIGELEKHLLRSAMMSSIASLSVLKAYNINNSIDLSKDLGSLYGIDGFLNRVDGVSADKISDKIRTYQLIGTIFPTSGKVAMESALRASRWAIHNALAAWKASSETRKNEDLYAIDTGYWRVNRQDIQANLEMTYRVIFSNKVEKLRSSVTGEMIEINYSAFFTAPPSDLKDFLPQEGDSRETVTRPAFDSETGKTHNITYRNYEEGSPKTWKVAAYQPYFPSVKTNDDVFRAVRVLSHAGGNWLALLK